MISFNVGTEVVINGIAFKLVGFNSAVCTLWNPRNGQEKLFSTPHILKLSGWLI
jgi:hypothetical protein